MQVVMEYGIPWLTVLFLVFSARITSRIHIDGESLHDWQKRRFHWDYLAPFSQYVVVIVILLLNQVRWGTLGVRWGVWTAIPFAVFGFTLLFFGSTIAISNYRSLHRLFIHFPGWSTLLFQGIYIPIGEELFWRGYLQSSVGLVVSAVVFGLMHALNRGSVQERLGGALYACVLGILFGYLKLATGGVLAGIILHSVFNVLNHLTCRTNEATVAASPAKEHNVDS